MPKSPLIPWLMIAMVLSSGDVRAQDGTVEQHTALTETDVDVVDEEARRWKLTREEYHRYLEALEGPRGRLSGSGMTPIEVLGIEATSPAERERYARLWVEMIRADTAKVLAFSRSVHDAWLAAAPDRKLIDPMLVARLKLQRDIASSPASAVLPARRLMFLATDCTACAGIAGRLIDDVSFHRSTGLDLYFVNASGDIAGVQAWAHAQDVPLPLVREGTITLNVDQGEFSRFKGPLGLSDALPVVLEQRGEGYEIIVQP